MVEVVGASVSEVEGPAADHAVACVVDDSGVLAVGWCWTASTVVWTGGIWSTDNSTAD